MTAPERFPPQPSFADCQAGERFTWQGQQAVCCVTPQIGGYVCSGVAVAVDEHPDIPPCIDLYWWGPLSGCDTAPGCAHEDAEPHSLHFCDITQWVRWVQEVTIGLGLDAEP